MPFHIEGLEKLRTQLGILVEQGRGFVADKPFLSGGAIAGLGALLGAGIAGIRRIRRRKKSGKRRRKTKKTGKRKRRRRTITRVHIHRVKHRHRRKHITHSRPRHRGHKRVSFTTKDGVKVNFLTKK